MAALLTEIGRDLDRDPRQGAAERRRMVLVIALTIVGVSAMVIRNALARGSPAGQPVDYVRTSVTALVTFVLGVAVFGRSLLQNRYHRAVLGLTLLATVQMILVRLALVLAEVPLLLLIQVDFITSASMFAVGGLLVGRWFYWVALLPAIGAAATVLVPDHAAVVAQALYPGFVIAYLVGWTRSSRKAVTRP